jgi:N,N'-diacetyllegionaminate synthase
VNHNGDLDAAKRLVDAAVNAGADAVKFQAFRAKALVAAATPAAAYQTVNDAALTQRSLLERLELPPDAFARLAEHCRAAAIEFLATPFGIDELVMLVELGVRAIKIASPDVTNTPLLAAAAKTGLPLIISTGAAEPDEIDDAVQFMAAHEAWERLILLHCVSSYPVANSDANLRRIHVLAHRTGRPAGFSDHTTSVEIGALAVAAGAVVLEKHFTLDRHQIGPDHGFSLEPKELAEYVARVRHSEIMLGDGRLEPSDAENEVRTLTRSSVVAAVPIRPGERVDSAMLTIKRPGTGIPPIGFDKVTGRIAAVDIPGDSPIQWEMLR